jgi:hypothetical protein
MRVNTFRFWKHYYAKIHIGATDDTSDSVRNELTTPLTTIMECSDNELASAQLKATPPVLSAIVTTVNAIRVISPFTVTAVPFSTVKSLMFPIGVTPKRPSCQPTIANETTAIRMITINILEADLPFFFGIKTPDCIKEF